MAPRIDLVARPRLRCAGPHENLSEIFCDGPVTMMGPSGSGKGARVFCRAHARPGDQPIAGELAIRVVTLQVDIVIAGVVPTADIAQVEADRRLRAAVDGIGGLVNLHSVRSQLVRWTLPVAPGGENGPEGDA